MRLIAVIIGFLFVFSCSNNQEPLITESPEIDTIHSVDTVFIRDTIYQQKRIVVKDKDLEKFAKAAAKAIEQKNKQIFQLQDSIRKLRQ